MKERTMLELLKLLQKELIRKNKRHGCGLYLCIRTESLYTSDLITYREVCKLIDHIHDNKPSHILHGDDAWYDSKVFKSRNNWLNKHIKLQSS